MIFFFIFILMLSIYEIHYIVKNANNDKKTLIIIYSFMTIMTLLLGIYYYSNRFGNSISYYMFKLLNINY